MKRPVFSLLLGLRRPRRSPLGDEHYMAKMAMVRRWAMESHQHPFGRGQGLGSGWQK